MAKAEEFRNEITSKIIAALENGTAPWQQPWRGTGAPYNAITKHQYNGINSVILSLAAMSMNKDTPNMYIFRAAAEASKAAAYLLKTESAGNQASNQASPESGFPESGE